VSSSAFDVGAMVLFGILGYIFKKLDFPIAPLILTLILGPLMEQALRRSLELSAGSFSIFFTRPMSATLLAISAVIVIVSMMRLLAPVRGQDSQV
jgi:putative tricarboxylic transport membrane protein